jgi:dihydroorotate dehydrogenase electron transfer subunit
VFRVETGTVAGVDQIGPALFLIHLELREIARSCAIGQFILVRCSDLQFPSFDPFLPRSYFVLGLDPEAGRLSLLVRRQGRGSGWLCARRPGDSVAAFGPAGKEVRPRRLTRHLLLLADGFAASVVAASVGSAAARRGTAVTLVEGVAESETGFPTPLLHPDVEYQTTSPESGGLLGALPRLLPWADEILVAAPPALLETLGSRRRARLAPFTLHANLPLDALLVPNWDGQGSAGIPCGIGVCAGCEIRLRRGRALYCEAGPAFALEALRFEDEEPEEETGEEE